MEDARRGRGRPKGAVPARQCGVEDGAAFSALIALALQHAPWTGERGGTYRVVEELTGIKPPNLRRYLSKPPTYVNPPVYVALRRLSSLLGRPGVDCPYERWETLFAQAFDRTECDARAHGLMPPGRAYLWAPGEHLTPMHPHALDALVGAPIHVMRKRRSLSKERASTLPRDVWIECAPGDGEILQDASGALPVQVFTRQHAGRAFVQLATWHGSPFTAAGE